MLTEFMQDKPHVLIVDDEEFNRLLLTRILERDHIIDMANTGQEALEKLEERDYDAVLLDIMMPDLNGIETLKIIRDVLDLSTLPIIFISAKDDNQTIIEGIELGANDFIAKPIDPGVVRARLSTHIQLKRLSDERKMTMRALEEANDMKLRMMQIASHDLKNPLNNLSLLVSVLNETIGTVPKFPNFMELAMNNIKSMTQIINDFLTANEFIGRQIQIDTDDVSSHDLIHEVLVQYALAAEKKSIDIVLEHVEEAIIFADENRTIQVVNNLVSNAIKYTPKGGTVTLRTFTSDMLWRLEIQDTGAGIPENQRQYLFKPFSKYEITTTPTAGESSTGLGLWIAAEMIHIQGGAIGMDSPDDGGCCFWIELPLAQDKLIIASA